MKKRKNLIFEEMNIPVGSLLYCEKTDEKALIVESNQVAFRGKTMSLTDATQDVVGGKDKKGALHYLKIWSYNERNFMDIYDEVYGEKV